MTIVQLLEEMEARQASDVFITVGKKPSLRIFGKLTDAGNELVTIEDFQSFFEQHLPPNLTATLQLDRDLDIGVSLSDDNRFRLNLFFQRGNYSIVARRVPSGALDLGNYRHS